MMLCLMMLVQALAAGFTVTVSAADGVTENLAPYQTSGRAFVHNGDYNSRFTMMGIDYLYGVRMDFDHSWIKEGFEILFNLGGNTQVLTFDVGNIDFGGSDSIMLQIYCDNNFFTEIELTYNMPTYHYVLNVAGVTQLKMVPKETKYAYTYALTNITAYTADAAAAAGIAVPTKVNFTTIYNSNLADPTHLTPYQTSGRAFVHNGDYNSKFTMMGIDYLYGVRMDFDHSWIKEGFEFLYNLGRSYEVVDFTIGNIDFGGSDKIVLQVYKDDVFFTEIELTYNMPTYSYSFNVSGTNQLKFVSKEPAYAYTYAIADMHGHTAEDVAANNITVPADVSSITILDTNYDDNTVNYFPYQTNGNVSVYQGDVNRTFAIMGTEYSDGILFDRDHSWIKGGGEILFNFGGMYHTMTFTVGHADNRGRDTIILQIYKNGEYSEEIELTCDMIARNYTVDLNGVNQLKIAMKSEAYQFGYGIANINVDGLGIGAPNRFSDIKYGQWYYNGVMYAYSNGYMKGTNTDMTLFSPNMQFTREQFVQLLFNMEGLNAADYAGSTGFNDVPAGKWYSAAVKWAKEAGVTSGIGGGAFGLGGKVSREQLAQFLKNYAEMKGYSTTGRVDINSFSDSASVSGWATEAVSWAVSVGLLGSTSTEAKVLSPARVAIRSEIAKITMSFDENVR